MGLNAGDINLYFVISAVSNYIMSIYIYTDGCKTLSRQMLSLNWLVAMFIDACDHQCIGLCYCQRENLFGRGVPRDGINSMTSSNSKSISFWPIIFPIPHSQFLSNSKSNLNYFWAMPSPIQVTFKVIGIGLWIAQK